MSRANSPCPDFIIGGAPRSGTTSLAQALDQHPEIVMAKPLIPEPKVFFRQASGGASAYLAHYSEFFTEDESRLRGEKSSNYFENEDAARRMRETFRHMRFLFILREPVDRAYSNYLWSRRNGLESLSFEQAVAEEGRRTSPLPPAKVHARPYDYMTRGDYGTFAKRYIEAFGRENVGFFLYEKLRDEPAGLLEAVQRFIGVEPMDLTLHVRYSSNLTDRSAGTLDVRLDQMLREKARPWVLEFAQATGLDVGIWGY